MLKKSITKASSFFAGTASVRWNLGLLGITLAIFLIALFSAHLTRPYNSDDVCIQNVIDSLLSSEKKVGIVGTDNFVIKVPLYMLADVIPNSRVQLLFIVLVCNLVLFLPIAYTLYRFILRARVYKRWQTLFILSPVMWFFSLATVPLDVTDTTYAPFFSGMYLNPNYRNAEFGLMLIIILSFSRYLFRPTISNQKLSLATIVLSIALSVFFYSDPFFIYTMGVAIALTALLFFISKKVDFLGLASILTALFCGAVGAKILDRFFASFGFIAANNIEKKFISTDSIFAAIQNTIHGIFQVFRADFWGRSLESPSTLLFLINALLLIFFILSIYRKRQELLEKTSVLSTVVIFVAIVTLCVYTITTSGALTASFRYLFTLALTSTLIIPLYMANSLRHARSTRTAMLIGLVCLFGMLANTIMNVRIAATTNPGSAQTHDIQALQVIKSHNLTKGYSTYWSSNILTYLSNRSTVTLPLICDSTTGPPVKFEWLLNIADFNLPAGPAGETYFLYDSAANEPQCDAMNRLGPAREVIKISGRYTLYIYDYDIGHDLQSYRPTR